MATLGEALARARSDAGLLQREVAAKVGLSTTQPVSNWERDINVPEGPRMVRLIEIYGMDEDQALLLWARAKTREEAMQAESRPAEAEAGHPLAELAPRPRTGAGRKRRGSGGR